MHRYKEERVVQPRIHWLSLALVISFYVIAGGFTAWVYRYEINPDGVSYILVAEQYRNGNWSNAVNGYWGPLVSWLLVPFLALGVDGQLAFRVVNVLVGGALLIGIWRVSRHFLDARGPRIFVVGVLSLLVLSWSVQVISPDLLGCCILIYLSDRLLDRQLLNQPRVAVLSGILAALLYFAKPFGFAFFLVAFPVAVVTNSLVFHRRLPVDRVIRTCVIGAGVFLALTAPWIVVISVKYGEFTTSPSGTRNLAFVGPDSNQVQLHDAGGFFPPPFDGAINGWYDPSVEVLPSWTPTESLDHFRYEIRNVVRNIWAAAWLIGPARLLPLVWLLLADRSFGLKLAQRSAVGLAVIIAVTHVGVYSLVRADEARYLWPATVLLLCCAVGIVWHKLGAGLMSGRVACVWLVALMMAWLLNPTGGEHGILLRGVNTGLSIHARQAQNRELSEVDALPESAGRTASNGEWAPSLYLSYYRDASYYGVISQGASPDATRHELDSAGIEWFLLWGSDHSEPTYLNEFRLVGTELNGDLRVYRRR